MGTRHKQGRKLALVLALLLAFNCLIPAMASAGGLSNTYVRLNRMMASTATSARIVFTTSPTPGTTNTVKIDFGTAWGAATTPGSVLTSGQTASSGACATDTGATALPGTFTVTGTNTGGSSISIAGVTTLAASTAYCVDLTNASAITNPSVGSYYITVTTQNGATVNDTTKVNVPIVTNDSITVTATVPPSFSFALDANTTAFTANLSPGTKQTTTPRTVTINTNAKTGWVAWLRNSDANGLYSSSVNYNITPTTAGTARDVDTSPSTEQYVWGVTASSQVDGVGSTTINTAYDATGGTNDGSGVDNAYRQIAAGNGTAQNAVLTLAAAATISPITPASSDYTDVVQVIGAGNF